MNKRTVGTEYELAAAAFLEKEGCRILMRNFRCRAGEIDLVAAEGAYLIFAEVKYRGGEGCGRGAEAVTDRKQYQISKTALCYLARHGISPDTPCRFDVITVDGGQIRHVRDAFPLHPACR